MPAIKKQRYLFNLHFLLATSIAVTILTGCSSGKFPNFDPNSPYLAQQSSCTAYDCHLSTRLGQYPPLTGKHQQHLSRGLICENCHYNYLNAITHKNGILDASTATVFVNFDGLNPNASWDNSMGDCSNLTCHGVGAASFNWYSAVANGCTVCHSAGSAFDPVERDIASGGKHSKHLNTGHSVINDINCLTCHTGYSSSKSHVNGTWDSANTVSFGVKYTGTWTDVTNSCNSLSCHGDAVWYSGTFGCEGCHNAVYSSYHPNPFRTSAESFRPAGPATSGSHIKHFINRNRGYTCETCHNGYGLNSNHLNGTYETSGLMAFNITRPSDPYSGNPAAWNDTTGKCSYVWCHGAQTTTDNWYAPVTLACRGCHVLANTTFDPYQKDLATNGRHVSHFTTGHSVVSASITCITCHVNYLGSDYHINGQWDTASALGNIVSFSNTVFYSEHFPSLSAEATWINIGATCSNVSCHGYGVTSWHVPGHDYGSDDVSLSYNPDTPSWYGGSTPCGFCHEASGCDDGGFMCHGGSWHY